MQSELKPCPFCGGEARIRTYETESLWSHDQVTYTQVHCDNCDVSFNSEPGMEPDAIAAWNTRASDAAITRLTSQLRAAEEREKALREDKARLDYLDKCNHRLNSRYGTSYGWKLILNHNVNRLMLDTPSGMAVDLHDIEGGSAKFTSCRKAIDESMLRAALVGGKP